MRSARRDGGLQIVATRRFCVARSIEPDLCAGAEEAGLKKILRDGIMERKKSAPPYSEEHWKAARKFAREHNSVVKLR